MKGPGIAVILGKKSPPKSEPDMEDEDDSEDEDMGAHKSAAMDEFIAAVHARDTAKACEAFDALKAMPDDEDDYEEEE